MGAFSQEAMGTEDAELAQVRAHPCSSRTKQHTRACPVYADPSLHRSVREGKLLLLCAPKALVADLVWHPVKGGYACMTDSVLAHSKHISVCRCLTYTGSVLTRSEAGRAIERSASSWRVLS